MRFVMRKGIFKNKKNNNRISYLFIEHIYLYTYFFFLTEIHQSLVVI